MNKTIEKIENYKEKTLTSAIEKLKSQYHEADACYRDTGFDRYWHKMQKCEAEIDELEAYMKKDHAIAEAISEKAKAKSELEKIKKDLSNKLFYLLAEFPECTDAKNLKEYIENL